MTTKSYNTLTTWTGSDVHTQNTNIGPQGDVEPGNISIRGDRFRHKRIGYAVGAQTKLTKNVDAARIENVVNGDDGGISNTIPSGSNVTIYVKSNEGFTAGDICLIEDANDSEYCVIDEILEESESGLAGIVLVELTNSYDSYNNCFISQTKDIYVESATGFSVGDLICLQNDIDEDSDDFKYYHVLISAIDDVIFTVDHLFKDFSSGDYCLNYNHSNYTRDANNPIIDLGRNYFFHHSGTDVSGPSFQKHAEIVKDSKGEVVWKKPAMLYTVGRERFSNQISMAFSTEETDRYNWSEILGDSSPTRLNPVIRNCNNMTDTFLYSSDASLKKLWDTEDASITVSADKTSQIEGVTSLQIDYTANGEVWGLSPLPFNAEVRYKTLDQYPVLTKITCRVKGNAGNDPGNLYITAVAADNTTTTGVFADVLQTGTTQSLTFDITDFVGKRYLRAIVFGVSLDSSPGSGTIFIDQVCPFVPPTWDEIVEDPSVIAGSDYGGLACYYTARYRPRVHITAGVTLTGENSYILDVSDDSYFKVNDICVLYTRTHHEMAKVTTVGTNQVRVQPLGYQDDTTATFNYEYQLNNQPMVAVNTYEQNYIGASYVLGEDKSAWQRYVTDAHSRKILSPSGDATKFDNLIVKQPSVKLIGSTAYMTYAGRRTSNGVDNIGLAFSTDFINFTRLNDGDAIISEGVTSAYNEYGSFHPDLDIILPHINIGITGKSSAEVDSIGSYLGEVEFLKKYSGFTVGMFLWCGATLGYPDPDGYVLFDIGNLRLELNDLNQVSGYVKVRGEEEKGTPVQPRNDDIGKWYSTIMHNRWYYLALSWDGYGANLRLEGNFLPTEAFMWRNPKTAQETSQREWMLWDNVDPLATTCQVYRNPYYQPLWGGAIDWTEAPPANSEILFDGFGTATDYTSKRNMQLSWVESVTLLGLVEGTTVWTLTLDSDNPIGPWGVSNNVEGISFGVLMGDGGLLTKRNSFILSIDTGDSFKFLDEQEIRDITFGNNIAGKRAFRNGVIGHAEILSGNWANYYAYYNAFQIYNTMIGSVTGANWWRYDLTGRGAEPATDKRLSQWLASDYDSGANKVPDGVGNYDLFLTGGAKHEARGYMGHVLQLVNKSDKLIAPIITDNFTSRGQQFTKSSSGFDSIEVNASNQFRHDNQFHLAYTGTGKELYRDEAIITGDLFEAGGLTSGVTFDLRYLIPTGCTIELYCSWQKRTNWILINTYSAGSESASEYVDMPGAYTDLFYNVKWKVRLLSNLPDNTSSPILKSLIATYNDSGYPSQAFLNAQDAICSPGVSAPEPIFKAELVKENTTTSIDITSYINEIVNIDRQIPSSPDDFTRLFIDSVTLHVDNKTGYFSPKNASSPFYNRYYLNDEIRFFSGFRLDSGNEYLTTGRFYINKVVPDSDSRCEIYCTSILDRVSEVKIGLPDENGDSDPYTLKGDWLVKDIMENLLIEQCGIDPDKVHIENFDRSISNFSVDNDSIGDTLQLLAQSCNGIVYTNNQGDIYFKRWVNLPSASTFHFQKNKNYKKIKFTGQDRKRMVREALILGALNVRGLAESVTLDIGRSVEINNEYIQSNHYANEIANDIIAKFGHTESTIEVWGPHLPSVDILQTIKVTSDILSLSNEYYLIYNANKGITNYIDKYKLMTSYKRS